MDILRFITAGNVDDGKSTLIGRLLYDTKNIKDDILESIGSETPDMNLAFVTDGLRAERAQGITIDVAYKYFATATRKYIITDAPGHFQYTRNLVTGASGVDAIIILVDACNGVTEQTKRHLMVAAFLGIKNILVAINKMDAIGYSHQTFHTIRDNFNLLTQKLQLETPTFIPISALLGDNVTTPSTNMAWYKGGTLMGYLENCQPLFGANASARFSVQCLLSTQLSNTNQLAAGKLLSGGIKVGDKLVICPNGGSVSVEKMSIGYDEVKEANAGQNLVLYLTGASTVERGDVLALPKALPICTNKFTATLCWLDDTHNLIPGQVYQLKINSAGTLCRVTKIIHIVDNGSYEHLNSQYVAVNQFAKVEVETTNPIALDLYKQIKGMGRGIMIDINTNYTSGAFVIEG